MKRHLRVFTRHLTVTALTLRVIFFFSTTPLVLAKTVDASPYPDVAMTDEFSPQDFLVLTNAARQEYGIPPLRLEPQLVAAAEAKAQDMARLHYWAHRRPIDGKMAWSFMEENGYDYKVAGENLALNYRTPLGITKAWMASPTHRANLLSPRYTDVGFASVATTDADGKPILLTVQMLGSR